MVVIVAGEGMTFTPQKAMSYSLQSFSQKTPPSSIAVAAAAAAAASMGEWPQKGEGSAE